jgi:hypothetical protein
VEIISRARWGARYAAGFGAAPLPAREVWLHHTATSTPDANADEDDDTGDVRQVERIGQDRFGGGISYTFAVCPSGRIYEGTGVTRKGAHTKGRNGIARAIVLVGNFDVTRPPQRQLDAVAWLVAHGARMGWWPGQLAGGHRDAPGANTACPGRYAYAAIEAINAAARQPPAQAQMLVEVHTMLGKLKPGTPLPGRSTNSRNGKGDDHFGTSLNAEANSADAVVEVRALRREVGELRSQLAAGGGVSPQAFADQVSTAIARKLAG